MTIGEKIQFQRKKLNLSQEQLGQMLFISRQTISLWEKDQTYPSIENIIKLKDIFGVTTDSLLCNNTQNQESELFPIESYSFKYSKEVALNLLRNLFWHINKRNIIINVILALLLLEIYITNQQSKTFSSILLGGFIVITIITVKTIITYFKSETANLRRIVENQYDYEIYDDYFILKISSNQETVKFIKAYFSDFKSTIDIGKYTFWKNDLNQLYIIDRSAIPIDSQFYRILTKHKQVNLTTVYKLKYKVISLSLFIATLISIYAALFCCAAIFESMTNSFNTNINAFSDTMWIFWLFLPIPVASVIYGFYLKSKGYKYRKNVIAGFIIAALLLIYGSFSFIM